MAICKKTIGDNTGRYYETFKKWLPNTNKDSLEEPTLIDDLASMILGAFMTPPEEDEKDEKDN